MRGQENTVIIRKEEKEEKEQEYIYMATKDDIHRLAMKLSLNFDSRKSKTRISFLSKRFIEHKSQEEKNKKTNEKSTFKGT